MSAGSEQRTIRCLIAKVGLNGHDRDAHVISHAFHDAGFEVIYSGLHRAPDEIIQATVQEDVDMLDVSILSGAYNTPVPKMIAGLEKHDALGGTLVIVDGIIPKEDRPGLLEEGVDAIFGPNTPMQKATDFVKEHAPERPWR